MSNNPEHDQAVEEVAEELLLTSLGKSTGFSCSMSEKVYSFCKIYIQIILFFALRVPRALCLRAKIMLYNIFTYYKFTAEDDAPMADAAEQELLGGRAGTPVFNHDEPRPSTPIDPPEGLLNGALSESTPLTTETPGETGENSKNLTKQTADADRGMTTNLSDRPNVKDKGVKAPLSAEARAAKRQKERHRKKRRRADKLDENRELTNSSLASSSDPNAPTDDTERPKNKKIKKSPSEKKDGGPHGSEDLQTGGNVSRLAPSEVFPSVTEPRFEMTITREGAGDRAQGDISFLLLLVPRNYRVGNIRPIADGVIMEMDEEESAGIVTEALEADGWTVQRSAIWARYWFHVPADIAHRPLEDVVRALLVRNGPLTLGQEGIPPGSLRPIGTYLEGREGDASRRLRAWVDVSPEAEQFLSANHNLLRTVNSGVRLRPAPRKRPNPKGPKRQ